MTANPVDLVYVDGSNVAKADVRAFEKARMPQVLANATEVRNTTLPLQLVILIKALGQNWALDTTDTTTADDGINCIISADGGRFKPMFGSTSGDATISSSGVLTISPNVVWKNNRLAKAANYSVVNADKFSTVALGGNTEFTLTINAASGFDANFTLVITNEDSAVSGGFHTGRGKLIAIDGYLTFRLFPGQTFVLMNQNSAWRFDYPGRWRVQGLPIFYVNHGSGSDANDGLTTGSAFATIQAAVIAFESYVDCNNFGPTIQNAAETFTENNVAHTHPLTGYHVISITGNTATPGSCIWQVSGTGNAAIQCRDTGLAIVTGFKFVSTGTGNFFISGSQDGVCDFGSLEFGANPGGFNIFVSPGGAANFFGGTMSWTGDCAGMVLMTGEGHLLFDGCTISVPSARAISSAFVQIAGPCCASMTLMTFTGAGAGAGSAGAKYLVAAGRLDITGTTTLPGATAGTAFAGGTVIPLLASKTNDNAQSGDIGEYIESVIGSGSAVSLVASAAKTVTSITLTSGDWDVEGGIYFATAGTTSVTRVICNLTLVTNALDTTPGRLSDNSYPAFVPGTVAQSSFVPSYRFSVAAGATLTVFLVGFSVFTVSTMTAYGIIRARRAR